MANEPGAPDSAVTAEPIVYEVPDSEEARAIFKDLATAEDQAVLAAVDAPEAAVPAAKPAEAAPASPPVAAPAVAPVVAPAPVAVDPAAAAQARHRARLTQAVEADLDAVEAARAARTASTPVARPPDLDLTDQEWATVIKDAKTEADAGASYGEAIEKGLTVLRKAQQAKRKAAEAIAPDREFQARVDAQITQAITDIPDWESVVKDSGLLTDITAAPGQQPRNPALAARVYGAPNVAEAAYYYALGIVARRKGQTLETALQERRLLPATTAAITPPVAAPIAAPAAAPAKPAVTASEAERAAVEKVTRPLGKPKGLRQFVDAGQPALRFTQAMLERAMTDKPDAFLKWAEEHRDIDRAFMSGELAAVNQP